MPRFYRMPAFYLTVLVLAFAIGLRTWMNPTMPEPATGPTPPIEAEAVSPPARVPEPDPASDGILRTADGLRRKVVITDLGVTCRDRPEGGNAVGASLDYFAIRFVFGESPAAATPMVQIGPREGPAQGWVPAASVLEWDTRLMAQPTARKGRLPLVMYREEACLIEVLSGRTCPRHGGDCPTEGEEPKSEGPAAALGMPILQSRPARGPDGAPTPIFHVASLVTDHSPLPAPKAPSADLLPLLRRVDVAFVIDTTKSMQATIDAARRLAEDLVANASRRHRDIELRLALVEYRDSSPVFEYTTRIVSQFKDPRGFLDALGTIQAARRGDGSVDEAVLDGVARALPPASHEPPDQSHLDWPMGRAGELATKMVVLLGDAPDHARDLVRAQSLAKLARRAGITIATVALDRPGTLSRDEHIRYKAQWHMLADSSFRPLDKARKFATMAPPVTLRSDQADRLVPALQTLIDDRIEHARNLAALAEAEAENRLTDYVNSQGLTLKKVAPVLEYIHHGDARAPHPRDPRLNGQKAASVRLGWIAERRGGKPLVTVEVLMSRGEITTLIDELSQLQQAAQGTSRDRDDLLRIGNAAAAGEAGFLTADRGTQTFADHLRRRRGLPPFRADSLLNRTQNDLLQADDLYRAALNARLATSLSELIRRRNAPDWNDPRRAFGGMALVPYAFFDF